MSSSSDESRKPAFYITDQREFWICPNGTSVVSNIPSERPPIDLEQVYTGEKLREVLLAYALNATLEWIYYGGFLVCESCTGSDAQRIANALNAEENDDDDYLGF